MHIFWSLTGKKNKTAGKSGLGHKTSELSPHTTPVEMLKHVASVLGRDFKADASIAHGISDGIRHASVAWTTKRQRDLKLIVIWWE